MDAEAQRPAGGPRDGEIVGCLPDVTDIVGRSSKEQAMSDSGQSLPAGFLLFEEVQKFRQPGMWLIALTSSLLVLGIFGYGIYKQIILGRPWGDRPMSDTRLILVSLFGIALAVGLLWLFYQMKLVVRVRRGCLHVRFFPFVNRHIPLKRIARWEARIYHPIREYGGWGIRYGGKSRGWAYNVSGNLGVQFEFQDGKRLLIGSRRADELVRALERAKE